MSKYRIVLIDSDYRTSNSYYVTEERRTFLFWSFWNHLNCFKNLPDARNSIKAYEEVFTRQVVETI